MNNVVSKWFTSYEMHVTGVSSNYLRQLAVQESNYVRQSRQMKRAKSEKTHVKPQHVPIYTANSSLCTCFHIKTNQAPTIWCKLVWLQRSLYTNPRFIVVDSCDSTVHHCDRCNMSSPEHVFSRKWCTASNSLWITWRVGNTTHAIGCRWPVNQQHNAKW